MLKIWLDIFTEHFVTMEALSSGLSVKKHWQLYFINYVLV